MFKINFKKIDPVRDWKIIITFFTLGLLVISIFSWKLYLSGEIGGGYFTDKLSPIDTTKQLIDKNKLQSLISTLETKQADFLKIKAGQGKLIDPSL